MKYTRCISSIRSEQESLGIPVGAAFQLMKTALPGAALPAYENCPVGRCVSAYENCPAVRCTPVYEKFRIAENAATLRVFKELLALN